jgi:hypothetical protein
MVTGNNRVIVMVANRTGVEVGYLAGKYPGLVGHLYSPGAERGPYPFLPYALDNGAFVAWEKRRPFDEAEWKRLLLWAAMSGQRPLWSIVPDVVADRAATLANWDRYAAEVRRFGFRPALALQDGMTFDDVPDADCVLFIGGTTEWKEAAIRPWCERFPGRVHVGRVNTWRRLWECYQAGATSVDGTGWFTKKGGQAADLQRFLEHVASKRAA